MKVPSKEELIHLKIQAAMRENFFETDQLDRDWETILI